MKLFANLGLLTITVTLLPQQTDYRVHGYDHSIWTEPTDQLYYHHSTSNLDSNDAKIGIDFHSHAISKESILRLFRSKADSRRSDGRTEVLDYFQSFYLTSAIVLSLLAYNRLIHSKQLKHNSNDHNNDEVDHQFKTKYYKVNEVVSDVEISLYCLLPLRTMSRIWGKLNAIELPIHLRKTVLNTYIKSFGCNLSEADDQDLTHYKNLNEFFRRALRPGVRPIDLTAAVVSPVDGTVLHFGKAINGRVEQVKGITYSVSKFLGPQTWTQKNVNNSFEYQKNLLMSNNLKTQLYSCIIYLSPGDYHRFHSPAEWSVQFRRHFAGQLLSVRPAMVRGIPNLFAINERVVYCGQWQFGFFSMTAVGATNVGSIKAYFDKGLVTNEKLWSNGQFHDHKLDQSIDFNRGDAFGEFNLGSTIVLVFEAPEDFEFSLKAGQRIKYGEPMTNI